MLRRVILFLLVVVMSFSFMGSPIARADEYDYSFETILSIAPDFTTTVRTIVEAEQLRDGASPNSALTVPVFGQNIQGVSAQLNGEDVSASLNDDGIRVALNSLQSGNAGDWSLAVNYSTQVVIAIGSSSIAMLPSSSFDPDITVSSETRTIQADSALGTFVTRGGTPLQTSSVAGDRITTWINQSGPLKQSVGILFGDETLANLSFASTLSNDGYWWKTKSVVLPPDTNQQKVFIDSISPSPSAIRLDVDGNIILDYRLRPQQSIDITASLRAVVSSYVYSLDDSLLSNDTDPLLSERYTFLNDTWTDSSLEFEATDTRPVSEVVEEIYDVVSEEYAEDQSESAFDSSLFRSNRLVGELRANKVPSRVVLGTVFGDGSDIILQPVQHAWVEAYVPGVGWISLDPSFEQNGNYFGVADVQRVALAIRGIGSDFPPKSLDNFVIDFSADAPPIPPVMTPIIDATKYMILPGLSIRSVTVTMPAGVVVDNTGIRVGDDERIPLGSLAPLQSTTVRSSSFLAESFTSESVQYGIFAQGNQLLNEDVIAQGTTSANYLPMIGLILLAILAVIIKILLTRFIVWRKNRKSQKPPKLTKRAKRKQKKDSVDGQPAIEEDDLLAQVREAANDDDQQVAPSAAVAPEPVAQPSPAPTVAARPIETNATAGDTMQTSNARSPRPETPRQRAEKKRPPLIQ